MGLFYVFEIKKRKKIKTSACDCLEERKRLISWVSWWKCFMVSSNDSGSFSPGPKIFGKKEGSRRPRAKLASVTVRGPPGRIKQQGFKIGLIFTFWVESTKYHNQSATGLGLRQDTLMCAFLLDEWERKESICYLSCNTPGQGERLRILDRPQTFLTWIKKATQRRWVRKKRNELNWILLDEEENI